MAERKVYYKLGPKATCLWDGSQKDPKNQTLAKGQCKALDKTPFVLKRLAQGGIEIASDEEVQAANAPVKKTVDANASTDDAKSKSVDAAKDQDKKSDKKSES